MLSEAALKSGTGTPAIWLRSAVIQLRLGNVAEAERRLQQEVVCPEVLSPGERSLSKQLKNELYR